MPAPDHRGRERDGREDGGRVLQPRPLLAGQDFDRAIRLDPNLASAFEDRGFAHLEQAKFAAAIADYDAAPRIDPKLARSLFGRGIARRRTGDKAGGDADIEAAKAIDNTVADRFARYGLKP